MSDTTFPGRPVTPTGDTKSWCVECGWPHDPENECYYPDEE